MGYICLSHLPCFSDILQMNMHWISFQGIKHDDVHLYPLQLNPKFLHTNSTSHTWPFSAIAELIGEFVILLFTNL